MMDEVDLGKFALDDIRELDEATQNKLLESKWPFPLKLPGCNTTGIDCSVVVLRRIFRHLPADSHCRAVIFGKRDPTRYEVEKEELDRFRAMFRYAWHHLPDLNSDFVQDSPLLRLEIFDRQRSLLNILLVDRHTDQSRISFEALMESEVMLDAFWGRGDLQPFRDVVGWQENEESGWSTKERDVTPHPISWKWDQEPSLETTINEQLRLRESAGGKKWMILPNWPSSLRVKMTTASGVSMDKVVEQRTLNLKGFELLAENGVGDKRRASETHNKYKLAVAVVLRSSKEGYDVVYTFKPWGSEFYPLEGPPRHEGPTDLEQVMVGEAMLYYSRVDVGGIAEDRSMPGHVEGDGGSELTDDQKFRERIKALDPGAETGLTPLSIEAEERLPKNIGQSLREAEERFFG